MAGGIGAFGGDYSGINQAVADRNANWRTMQQLIESQTARRMQERQANAALALQRELGMAGVQLDRDRLAQAGSQFDRSLGLQERQFGAEGDRFNASLELQRMLGLGGQDIQRAGLAEQGRQFDTTSAFQRERAGVSDTQFDRTLKQRQEEYGMDAIMRRNELGERQRQFDASLKDRGLDRASQENLAALDRAMRLTLSDKEAASIMAQIRERASLDATQRTQDFERTKELQGTYAEKAKAEQDSVSRLRFLEGLISAGRMDEARELARTGDYSAAMEAGKAPESKDKSAYRKTEVAPGTDEATAKDMTKYDWLSDDEIPIVQAAEDKVASAAAMSANPDIAEEVVPKVQAELVKVRKSGLRTERDKTVESLLRQMLLMAPSIMDRNVSMYSNDLLTEGREPGIFDFLDLNLFGGNPPDEAGDAFKALADKLSKTYGIKVD